MNHNKVRPEMQLHARLRPMSVAEIFDAAFVTYQEAALPLLRDSTIGTVPLALALMMYHQVTRSTSKKVSLDAFAADLFAASVAVAILTVWWGIARGALLARVFGQWRSEPSGFDIWRMISRKPIDMAALAAVCAVGWGVCGVLLLLPVFWFVAGTCLWRPVLVVEETRFLSALQRSRQLLRGLRFKALLIQAMFGLLWLFSVINLVVAIGAALELCEGLFIIDLSFWKQFLWWRNPAYIVGLNLLLFIVLDPFKTCVDALFYLDACLRAEGFDLQMRVDALRVEQRREREGARRKVSFVAAALAIGALLGAPALALAQLPQSSEMPERARAELRTIMQREEFQELRTDPDLAEWWKQAGNRARSVRLPEVRVPLLHRFSAWLRRVAGQAWNWIRNPIGNLANAIVQRLQRILGGGRAPHIGLPPKLAVSLATLAAIALIGFTVALIVWIGWGRLADRRGGPLPLNAAQTQSTTENALDHTPDEWQALAAQGSACGDYRAAMRALYLALLVHLHRARLIDYHQAHTNWVYVRRFRGDDEQRGALRELTRAFDDVWYGGQSCDPQRYDTFARSLITLTGGTGDS